jgi:IS30 family transposase
MEGMALPKYFISVISGKHVCSIYRELNRNGTNRVYTGNEAQALSVQRRLETKPSPKLDNPALTQEIMALFKQDRSADQISGRRGVRHPDQREKQASTSTVYTCLYGESPRAERALQTKTGETTPAEGDKRPPWADT